MFEVSILNNFLSIIISKANFTNKLPYQSDWGPGGLSPSKNSASQKSKNLSFCRLKKVNSWNFQTQKSKPLYFDSVLPECCSSMSLQIIFMALATVFRITLAFWNYLRKSFVTRYLAEALLVITVNFSHY